MLQTQLSSEFSRYVRAMAMMEVILQQCSRSLLLAGHSCGVASRRQV